jgi:hypothetical protein
MPEKMTKITFHKDGTRSVEAIGYHGSSCKEATKYLEDALGIAGEAVRKAEWFLENTESIKQAEKLGLDSTKFCG